MTKLLADENIPKKTIEILRKKKADITSITDTRLGLSDRKIIEIANNEGRIIVTFDKDFGELIFRERLKVKGLIFLRMPPTSPEHIAERIEHILLRKIPIENKIVVIREDTIRVTQLR